jgi:hypothetical protein
MIADLEDIGMPGRCCDGGFCFANCISHEEERDVAIGNFQDNRIFKNII